MKLRLATLLSAISAATLPADIVINEIMYHPASESTAEEWIELHNTGTTIVDVSNWQFTSGVTFTIPATTEIPSGDFLVVAADADTFSTLHPTVTNVVAGWTGILSNSSNRITLRDELGTQIDEVKYTDDGDWAIHQKDLVPDYGHRGWGWDSNADGLGSSLELINPSVSNKSGQNWAASTAPGGSPGVANPSADSDIAPLILDTAHFPLIPTSSDPVHVTARIIDDGNALDTATVHYRIDGDPAFTSAPMSDDGAHGDTLPGDGIFGATLPIQADGIIIEFYISAADSSAHTRTWPAAALDENGIAGQTANCLYLVDDTAYAGATPLYRLIMRAVDRTELKRINTDSPSISGLDQTRSEAKVNATFISQSGTGNDLRYRCHVRNRGESSRRQQPQSFRISFLEQQSWDGVTGLNLNAQYTPHQLLASAAFRKAGVTTAFSRAVELRVNTSDPASSTGSPAYGFYVANEVINSDFVDQHHPLDSGGNIYRIKQVIYNGSSPGGDLHDWSDDPDPAIADPTRYRIHYLKRTNSSEDQWSDIIRLTQKLAKGQSPSLNNPAWDPDYATEVAQVADVTQWMRFFAANTIADNTETNISNGRGDDYSIYFGKTDARARLIPYDHDSVFGRSSGSSASHSLWLMCRNNILSGDPPGPLNPFMKHPEFAPIYFAELRRMIDGTFAPANFNPLVDEMIGGLVQASVATSIKSFNASRTSWIRQQIPLTIEVTTAPSSQDGYPHTTAATATLGGRANAITTRSVTVNGTPAEWTAWTATWSAPDIPLNPGINRILIQAFDADGIETGRLGYDVWFDDGTVETIADPITADTTWTAADGPYEVSSSLTVASGATLTIEAGTTVYLGSGADFDVASGGRIMATGTATAPIRFTRAPGSSSSWGTLTINGGGGTPESTIAHARFDLNGSPAIDVNGGDVVLDHLEFGKTTSQYLSLDGASFVVSHCHFPDATTSFEATHGTGGVKAGGRGIFRHCYFGTVMGYSDALDFSGGKRPGPILELIDNVFAGSGDDILDLDGTDTWIEGNIFLHCHKNDAPDSAAAISGGDGGGNVSNITIVGNIFYDNDHALTAKQGNFYTFINNTVVRQTIEGGTDIDGGVINMRDTIPDITTWGIGCHAVGNIIADAEKLAREDDPAETAITLDGNLLPFAWTGTGSGNITGNPLFVHVPELDETYFTDWQSAQVLREWLALQPGSAGKGTGPGGRDMGGIIPLGVSVSGTPTGTTNLDSATLTVGPLLTSGIPWDSGFTHYTWRLDGGPWSAETPTATPVSLTGLAPGDHFVEVVGKNDGELWQDDPELGEAATITTTTTWSVDPGYTPPAPEPLVRINEVLAKNTETLEVSGAFPDLIELHNAGTDTADLEGWGLTDNAALPFKFTFPAGTTLDPGDHLIIHATSDLVVSEPRTGFGLKTEGDTITLTRSATDGGGVADSVSFGAQLADSSIGRRTTDGGWDLCFPTFGSANVVAPRGPVSSLRINEWLASSGALFATDFIELFNSSTLPVDIGLGYLTDNPTEWPDRHPIRQLTFIAPGGYAVFKADGDPQDGPDHLAFNLSASQGEIGLFDASMNPIDGVIYGPQTTGVSLGSSPNGSDNVTSFPQPSPGSPNPYNGTTTTVLLTELIPVDAEWTYDSSGTDHSGLFDDPSFDDSGWSSGGQLLYIEGSSLPSASGFVKTTGVPGNPDNSDRPFRTTYFRHHFTYSGPLTDVTLRATVMFDDGAVIYLNGEEVKRIRMDSGPVGYATEANSNVSDASEETVTIPSDHLVNGDNVIAVEVHQNGSNSSDVVLGIRLQAETSNVVITTDNLIPVDAEWKYASDGTDHSGLFQDTLFDDAAWPSGAQLLTIENSSLPSASGFVKTTTLIGDPANPGDPGEPDGPYRTTYFRRHFTYNGPFTDLTLRATLMVDDGAVIYLNGQETKRIRMDAGAATSDTWANENVSNASEETVIIPHTYLVPGDNVIAVEVHQQGTNSSDVVFGMKLDAEVISTPGNTRIVINEVLVDNATLTNPDSSLASWIELHNPGNTPVDLGDMSLTDSFGDPRRWVFPADTIIPAGSALVVQCDPLAPASATNTALNLNPAGDSVILFDAPTTGGGLRDSVSFGHQLPDLSIGRSPNATGAFTLTIPTRDALNQAAALASTTALHLNEWLASGSTGGDWFEIYNTAAGPVLLGGNYLTDNLSDRTKFQVPPLSFIGGSGNTRWLQLFADGNGSEAGHTNFSLKASGEELGIFTAAGVQIDAVAFGAQSTDVSEGSVPDGSSLIVIMPPTPAAANTQFVTDTDGDGIPDGWEDTNGLDSGFAGDALLDTDGDGQSNLAEFIAGTDPQDSSSVLAATPGLDGSGRPRISFQAIAGHDYSVLWSDTLEGDWNKLTDIAPQSFDTLVEVTDTSADGIPGRFYRIITPAQP